MSGATATNSDRTSGGARVLPYRPEMDANIKGAALLPRGLGWRYLVCLEMKGGTLIARSWTYKFPDTLRPPHVILDFKPGEPR